MQSHLPPSESLQIVTHRNRFFDDKMFSLSNNDAEVDLTQFNCFLPKDDNLKDFLEGEAGKNAKKVMEETLNRLETFFKDNAIYTAHAIQVFTLLREKFNYEFNKELNPNTLFLHYSETAMYLMGLVKKVDNLKEDVNQLPMIKEQLTDMVNHIFHEICLDGIRTHVVHAYHNIGSGLNNSLKNLRHNLALQLLQELSRKNDIYPGNELHYVNQVRNRYADPEHYGLLKIKDNYLLNAALVDTLSQQFAVDFGRMFNLSYVLEHLMNCLNDPISLIKKHLNDERLSKHIRELCDMLDTYGKDELFHMDVIIAENDKGEFQLTTDYQQQIYFSIIARLIKSCYLKPEVIHFLDVQITCFERKEWHLFYHIEKDKFGLSYRKPSFNYIVNRLKDLSNDSKFDIHTFLSPLCTNTTFLENSYFCHALLKHPDFMKYLIKNKYLVLWMKAYLSQRELKAFSTTIKNIEDLQLYFSSFEIDFKICNLKDLREFIINYCSTNLTCIQLIPNDVFNNLVRSPLELSLLEFGMDPGNTVTLSVEVMGAILNKLDDLTKFVLDFSSLLFILCLISRVNFKRLCDNLDLNFLHNILHDSIVLNRLLIMGVTTPRNQEAAAFNIEYLLNKLNSDHIIKLIIDSRSYVSSFNFIYNLFNSLSGQLILEIFHKIEPVNSRVYFGKLPLKVFHKISDPDGMCEILDKLGKEYLLAAGEKPENFLQILNEFSLQFQSASPIKVFIKCFELFKDDPTFICNVLLHDKNLECMLNRLTQQENAASDMQSLFNAISVNLLEERYDTLLRMKNPMVLAALINTVSDEKKIHSTFAAALSAISPHDYVALLKMIHPARLITLLDKNLSTLFSIFWNKSQEVIAYLTTHSKIEELLFNEAKNNAAFRKIDSVEAWLAVPSLNKKRQSNESKKKRMGLFDESNDSVCKRAKEDHDKANDARLSQKSASDSETTSSNSGKQEMQEDDLEISQSLLKRNQG